MSLFLLAQVLTLGGALSGWANEIGGLSGQPIVVLRLEPGKFAAEELHARTLQAYFSDPALLSMYTSSQALSLNPGRSAGPGRPQFILVNPLLAPAEEGAFQALLAHELGHLWIKAMGFPSPRYLPGEAACLAVATGDALQHILMRWEMDRRKIPWRQGVVTQIGPALGKMREEKGGATGKAGRCQKLAQVSLWLDVSLGLTSADWTQREEFLALMKEHFPAASAVGERLAADLKHADLADKQEHRRKLELVFSVLKDFAVSEGQ